MATIQETFTLPSHGLIYDKPINPEITLRSMTTMDELKRLSPSDLPYKNMCELIDSCMVGNKELSSYDMCIGDYQFLMHKLRIVTYGPDYNMIIMCPNCNKVEEKVFNLEELEILEYDESIKELFSLFLPKSNTNITLKVQTPRLLDDVVRKKKEMLAKNKDMIDPSFTLTLMSCIDLVDGNKLDKIKLERFVQNLPMYDANLIINRVDDINKKVGIDTVVYNHCDQCGYDYLSTFRITNEFFRPTTN